jgi:hypothetical protein
MSRPDETPRQDVGPQGAPGALLRLSHRFGRNASRSPNEGTRETVERALSRSTGRVGHFLDGRNPSGLARVPGGGNGRWVVVAMVALLALVVLARRRRR